ncbi:MAG: hypothetical protein DSZ05_05210 [Sulfurospirillum sp.]|nr:MAG: hypothetical protein DSZ05_05210 [Sulfurospirillum sp.]
MKDIEQLAHTLGLSEERLMHKLDAFLIYAQVELANLEDAIEQKKYKKIVRHAHKLSVKADKLNLDEIYIHTEHIEILAMFKRDTDYMLLFNELHEALFKLHEEFAEAKMLFPAR